MASTLGKSNNPLNLYCPEVEAVLPKRTSVFKGKSRVARVVDMSFGPIKYCSGCKQDKNRATDFCFDKGRKDGLYVWCRECNGNFQKTGKKYPVTEEYWTKNRIEVCKDKIEYWTNELNRLTGPQAEGR